MQLANSAATFTFCVGSESEKYVVYSDRGLEVSCQNFYRNESNNLVRDTYIYAIHLTQLLTAESCNPM